MKNHAMMTAVILAAITPAVLWVFGARAGDAQPLEVVDRVELDRYLGKWYSVASIPQFFDKDCAGGTTADYSLLDNGEISVVNACYLADGSRSEAKGRAWVADESTNARLKVSFIPIPLIRRLFAGDYWIIELGENYEYSVVGHPSRKYGWVSKGSWSGWPSVATTPLRSRRSTTRTIRARRGASFSLSGSGAPPAFRDHAQKHPVGSGRSRWHEGDAVAGPCAVAHLRDPAVDEHGFYPVWGEPKFFCQGRGGRSLFRDLDLDGAGPALLPHLFLEGPEEPDNHFWGFSHVHFPVPSILAPSAGAASAVARRGKVDSGIGLR